MSERQGAESYLKFSMESIYGDGTTPLVSMPVKSGSCKPTDIFKSRASELRASRFPQKPLSGAKWTPQNFLFNTYPDIIGYFLLLHYSTPSVNQINPGVYDNTFEPGLTVDKSMSTEFSMGGANPILVAGFMSNELAWTQGIADEAQMLNCQISGGGRFGVEGSTTTFTDLSTQPFQYDEMAVTLADTTIYLDNLNWTDTNGLVIPNHKISGGTAMRQPVLDGQFIVRGSFTQNFDDMTNFDYYKGLTDLALVITYTTSQVISGAYVYTLTITIPAIKILTDPLPEVGAPGLLKEPIEFQAFAGTVGASTVPISYTLRCGTDFSA